MNKKWIAALLTVSVCLASAALPCSAQSASESPDAYILSDGERIPMPASYTCQEALYDFAGRLNGATDLHIDGERLYIADTGNNRVIVTGLDGNGCLEITQADGLALNKPGGVTTDDVGGIYVADSGNGRILHFSPTGKFIEAFTSPDSTMLGNDFIFNPTKLVVTPTGYIYAIKSQTIMTIDAQNRFHGYLGQPEVGFDLVDALVRLFASEEQKKMLDKRTAEPYTNITLGDDGLLYATSRDSVGGEIKVLNSVGENIYAAYGTAEDSFLTGVRNSFYSLFNIGVYTGKSMQYGERRDDEGEEMLPVFADIAVDASGIITVIEETTAKCYQYDQQGNLLTVFAGKGNTLGRFQSPTSIASGPEGSLYILDSRLNSVQVFRPTAFIQKVHTACGHYTAGDYEQAYAYWEEIQREDANYELAGTGMGKALYKQKDYKGAMQQFRRANDPDQYSAAYAKYRHQLFREHFLLALLLGAVAIGLLALCILGLRRAGGYGYASFCRRDKRRNTGCTLCSSLQVLSHPIDTFEAVRDNRGRLGAAAPLILIAGAVAVRFLSLFLSGYCMRAVDLRSANLWLELGKVALPVLSWAAASFMVSAISDGESKFMEVFTASAFCMTPMLVATPLFTLLSHILTREEAGIFNALQVFMWCWILLLFFLSVKTLNGYTVCKTLAVCLLSLAAMALIWAVCFLFLAILGEVWGFLSDVFREFHTRMQ